MNIRALKDKLSAYLRKVQQGDIVLVSDRGRVVAEIRSPTLSRQAVDALSTKLDRLIERGVLKRGLANASQVYRVAKVRLSAEVVDRALAETRGER